MMQKTVEELTSQLEEANGKIVELATASGADAGAILHSKLGVDELRARLADAVTRCYAGEDAERDVETFGKLLAAHPEEKARKRAARDAWDAAEADANAAALRVQRTFVPPDVALTDVASVAARGAPPALAKRLFAKRATWLARADPARVAKFTLVDLRNAYDCAALDATELRAAYAAVRAVAFEADPDGAKHAWREALRARLIAKLDAAPDDRDAAYGGLAAGPFDADAAAEVAPCAKAVVDRDAAAAARDRDVAAALKARRETAAFAPAPAAARAAAATPGRVARDDPRTAMLAAVLGGGAAVAAPAFLAELRSAKKARAKAPAPSPAEPAFLAELRAKAAPSPAKPAFLAELRAKAKPAAPKTPAKAAAPAFLAELLAARAGAVARD